MTDQKTLAYINLFGVLGSITELCRQVPEAQALIADKKITISFVVKNGP
jgi:hypothetical protein